MWKSSDFVFFIRKCCIVLPSFSRDSNSPLDHNSSLRSRHIDWSLAFDRRLGFWRRRAGIIITAFTEISAKELELLLNALISRVVSSINFFFVHWVEKIYSFSKTQFRCKLRSWFVLDPPLYGYPKQQRPIYFPVMELVLLSQFVLTSYRWRLAFAM